MAEEKESIFINTSGWRQDEVADLDDLVEELKTDRSKLIRQIVAEKVDEYKHIKQVRVRTLPRIKQAVKS